MPCYFLTLNFFSQSFSTFVQRTFEKSKSVEVIGFSASAISVLNNAELFISVNENSLIHMDVDRSK